MNDSDDNLEPGEIVDLAAIATRVWYWKRLVATSIILVTAVFTAAAFLMTPIYRSSVVFVPGGPARASLGGALAGALGSLAELGLPTGPNGGLSATDSEEALAVLKSREFTEAFIADRHLIGELFPRLWDAGNQRWKVGVVPPTAARAYKYFNSIRSVYQDRRTGLITLQIDWRDRSEAAEWANDLLKRVNAEMRSRAIRKADAAIGYLEKELSATTVVATRDAIGRLMETQINERMLADVTEEYAFRVVDKAMPADKSDVLWPKKLLLVVVGMVLGVLLGVAAGLVVDGVNRKPANSA